MRPCTSVGLATSPSTAQVAHHGSSGQLDNFSNLAPSLRKCHSLQFKGCRKGTKRLPKGCTFSPSEGPPKGGVRHTGANVLQKFKAGCTPFREVQVVCRSVGG